MPTLALLATTAFAAGLGRSTMSAGTRLSSWTQSHPSSEQAREVASLGSPRRGVGCSRSTGAATRGCQTLQLRSLRELRRA